MHTDNIDPESAYNNTNGQGLELNGYPATRNVGFNVIDELLGDIIVDDPLVIILCVYRHVVLSKDLSIVRASRWWDVTYGLS